MAKDKSPGGEQMHPHDPYAPRSFGGAPRVGQGGKPYSGQNAHNVHQAKTTGPEPGSKSGKIPLGGPKTKS